jgi:uncharacterized membrane protein YeaQ/YmgE (transglycosylase-associated protein family)
MGIYKTHIMKTGGILTIVGSLAGNLLKKTPAKNKKWRNIGLGLLGAAGGIQMAEVDASMQNVVDVITAITALVGAITTLINQLKTEGEEK